jgi:hypothetical protein
MNYWDEFINRRIEKAREDGAFEIPQEARGKPLDLSENPYVPEASRMAFKIMKENDIAPEWIMDGKDIRQAVHEATMNIERAHKTFRTMLRKLATRVDVDSIYAREDAYGAWDDACQRFRKAAEKINRMIITYNLKVPISDLQHLRFDPERVIERLEAQNAKNTLK